MPLTRLIYVSRVANSVRLEDAERIAAASRANNRAAGLSGYLLYSPRYFVQVLEGKLNAVESTFERIAKDARHNDVRKLEVSSIAEREFGDWDMGFAHLGSLPDGDAPSLETWTTAAALAVLRRAARASRS